MQRTLARCDVVIAGGGPAGLAAALYTARYGLRTLVLDRGRSALKQCAYLDNYLGFPGGITVTAFLDLARAQVLDAGAQIVKDRVVALEHAAAGESRFTVRTKDGASFATRCFVAASPYDVRYLRTLDGGALLDEAGAPRGSPRDAYGRTAVDGLYLAGPLAGVESQALISAGHGAQVALGLIRDMRRAQGLWDAIAPHWDWLVPRGCYDGVRWADRVYRYFREAAPAAFDGDYVQRTIADWIRKKRAQQLDKAEVRRRAARGRRMLAAHLARGALEDAPASEMELLSETETKS